MSDNNQRPTSWPATWAGMLPFLLWGVFLTLNEIPREWTPLASLSRLQFLIWGVVIFPSLGVGIGWVKNFPRWSYPYTGLALVFSMYMTVVATPGLRFFNYTFGSDDWWGWRAWAPLMTASALALLITRSMQPVVKLITNIWQDWTRLTFAMFGFMPLVVWISFDEVDRLYTLPFMVAVAFVMTITALFYLRAIRSSRRMLALAIGITLTACVAAMAPAAYWMQSGGASLRGAVLGGSIVIVVMFSPGLVGLLRQT